MTVVVELEDVAKRFVIRKDKSLKERLVNRGRSLRHRDEFWALDGVSMAIESGTTVGLIGPNGSGKSTLLKTIGGIIQPTRGSVRRRGRLAALLELGAGFHPDLTGRENVYLNAAILGLSRETTDRHFDEIVDFSGIERFIDTQVKFYSSGMYVRLAFAVAVHVDPDILLVDEVLAVGDEPFQRKCLERIKQFQLEGRTIILVSHGLDQVRQLCDRVIMLEHGNVVIDGGPAQALRKFREMYAPEVSEHPDEYGHRRLEILKTIITDADRQPRDRFEPGDVVGIELEVLAHESTDDWVAGIAIFNHLDTLIYGTNSSLRGVELGTIDGRSRVRFELGRIPMVEGQYFVTVAVHNRDESQPYHRIERSTSFRVLSPTNEPGVLHLDVRCEVLPE